MVHHIRVCLFLCVLVWLYLSDSRMLSQWLGATAPIDPGYSDSLTGLRYGGGIIIIGGHANPYSASDGAA